MPIYEIEAPNGQVFEIEGDSPPTEQELEQIFTSIQTPQQANIPETQIPISTIEAPQMPQQELVEMPQTEQPRQDMTWGQASLQGLKNIPSSGLQMAKDIGSAIASPVQTAKSIGKLAGGLAVKGAKAISPESMDYLPELEEMERYPEAFGQFYKQRYGGSENIKQTLAQDPAGLISDLATALTLGGGAVSKLGSTSKVGKAGRVLSKVGSAIEPVNIAGKGLSKLGSGVGSLTKNILGMTTGAGADAISEAVKSGRQGSKAFTSNLRGSANIQDVVDSAKDALNTIKQAKNEAYASQIGKTINDPAILNIEPIHKKMLDIIDDQYYKGIAKSGKDTMNKLDEMIDVYNDFVQNPELRTAGGFDALKQRIQDINIPMDNRKAQRLQTSLVNTIKNTIEKQSPQYANTMKDYSQASELINELEKGLSLGKKSSVDSAIRKLQSVTRNNASTNYGNRIKMVEELNRINPDIMPSLAGQSLSSVTPRGLQTLGATGAGVAGLTTNPTALITLPAFSPRVVGEGAYLTGQLQDILNKMPVGNINRGSYQVGRINRITEENR